jgi:hypothetical protein
MVKDKIKQVANQFIFAHRHWGGYFHGVWWGVWNEVTEQIPNLNRLRIEHHIRDQVWEDLRWKETELKQFTIMAVNKLNSRLSGRSVLKSSIDLWVGLWFRNKL